MYGRSVSAFGLLILLLSPAPALARKQSLVSGAPIGIGFATGAERAPKTDFASGTAGYGHYFLFMPYFDLLNITFQPYAGWHFYPTQNGTGTEGGLAFTESSSAGNFSYGLRLMLSPFISKNYDARGYFVLGAGNATVKASNSRTFTASGIVNNEKVTGSGLEMQAGAGMEFILVQNYSLQIEGGYVQRNVDGFGYSSTTDVNGVARNDGDDVIGTNGRKRAFHVWSPYLQLALNLNF